MEKVVICKSCLEKFKIKREKEEDFLNFICQKCIDTFGKDIKIEMIDILILIDLIKHLDTLNDTIEVNLILKKYNINRNIKW